MQWIMLFHTILRLIYTGRKRTRKRIFFLWSLLLLNVNTKLDSPWNHMEFKMKSLWTHLEMMSLSPQYKWALEANSHQVEVEAKANIFFDDCHFFLWLFDFFVKILDLLRIHLEATLLLVSVNKPLGFVLWSFSLSLGVNGPLAVITYRCQEGHPQTGHNIIICGLSDRLMDVNKRRDGK